MMTRGLFAIALSCLALFCTAVATQSFFSEPRKLVLGFGSFFGVGGIGLSNVRELQNAVNTSVIAVNKAGDCENIAVRNAETANSSRYTYWKGAPCGMVVTCSP